MGTFSLNSTPVILNSTLVAWLSLDRGSPSMIVSLIARNCQHHFVSDYSSLLHLTLQVYCCLGFLHNHSQHYAISRQPAKFFLWHICMVVIWWQTRKSKEQQTWRPQESRSRRQMWLCHVIRMHHHTHPHYNTAVAGAKRKMERRLSTRNLEEVPEGDGLDHLGRHGSC